MAVNVGQRNVPFTAANTMFYAVDAARRMAVYTTKICSNKKVFVPEYKGFTKKIVKTALSIYSLAWAANNVRVTCPADWKIRSKKQKKSIAKCYSLLGFIDMARSLFHLRGSRVKHWTHLVKEARDMIRNWHSKDRIRYANLASFSYPLMEAS